MSAGHYFKKTNKVERRSDEGLRSGRHRTHLYGERCGRPIQKLESVGWDDDDETNEDIHQASLDEDFMTQGGNKN